MDILAPTGGPGDQLRSIARELRAEFECLKGRTARFRKLAQIYRHLAITMAVKVEEAMDRQKDPMIVKRSYSAKWKAHQRDFDKQAARYLKANQ